MKKMTSRRVIDLGPFDWGGRGVRDHRVELEIELRYDELDRPELSVCGTVWDDPDDKSSSHVVAMGQCLDEIFGRKDAEPWLEIYGLWRRWHLNGLTAGSPRQEAAIDAWKLTHAYSYDGACAMLEKIGLLEDGQYLVDGKPYRYGTAWLYEPIDMEGMAKIRKWLDAGKSEVEDI